MTFIIVLRTEPKGQPWYLTEKSTVRTRKSAHRFDTEAEANSLRDRFTAQNPGDWEFTVEPWNRRLVAEHAALATDNENKNPEAS